MFFRRKHVKETTFEERLQSLRDAGFKVDILPDGHIMVSRNSCAAVLENPPGGPPRVVQRAGILLSGEIATLVDGGFQKFFLTPSGKRKPALAAELTAVHDFQEDLREILGMTSLYNESLGTVSNQYLYDRVKDRDRGVPKRAWEK